MLKTAYCGGSARWDRRFITKTLLVMKLTFILTMLAFLNVSAESFSQTVSYSGKNVTLETVFAEVEKQTGYFFLYPKNALAGTGKLRLKASNMPLVDFLNMVFRDQPLKYSIASKTINVSPLKARVTEGKPSDSSLMEAPQPVSGRVVDSLGNPVAGASVRLMPGNKGTSSDLDGTFLLSNVSPGNYTLEISLVGHKRISKEIMVAGNEPLTVGNLLLRPNPEAMVEVQVVNTGYQNLPKERATGSFSTVSNKQLELRPTLNILDRLEGFAGGVSFHRNSVDQQPRVVVRGRSTIYSNDQPLYVVDGFPIEGDISNINPNDVESITILKDAAASSIWGVRAANGVVVIVTKKGSFNQKPVVKMRSHLMVAQQPDFFYLPFMATSDYVNLEKSWFEDGRFDNYFNQPPLQRIPLSPVIQTLFDVQNGVISAAQGDAELKRLSGIDLRNQYSDEFYRNRVQQQHVLNIQGGSEWMRYFFSAGYDKELSAERGNGLDRITMRADNSIKLSSRLDLNVGVNVAWTKNEANGLGLFGLQGESPYSLGSTLTTQYAYLPYQELRDAAGNALSAPRDIPDEYNNYLQGFGMQDWSYRPADEPRFRNNTTRGQDTRITVGLAYRLHKNLTADLKYQFEGNFSENKDIRSPESYYARNIANTFSQILPDSSGVINYVPVGGVLLNNHGKRGSHTFRGQMNYTNEWGSDHALAVIGGMELRDILYQTSRNTYYGYNDRTLLSVDIDQSGYFPHFIYNFPVPLAFAGAMQDQMRQTQNRYASFYSNASYTFRHKYTLSASGRMDKSSLFGVSPKDRNVPLWSAGAAWDVLQEPFFNAPLLSRFKLRATYGFNGNVSPAQSAFPIAEASIDPMTNQPTANITSPANPLLQWEKVSQLNLGIDFGIAGNKLFGSVEWFNKYGRDLLGDHFLDPSSGFATIRSNVAAMRGSGFDVELNYHTGKTVTFNSRLIFSHAKDKVTAIATVETNDMFGGTQNFMNADRNVMPILNRPVYSIYSYKWAGLDNQGNPQLFDEKGNIGDYATILASLPPDQLVYNGPVQPTFFGGWNNNVGWKGFNMSATVTYKFGHKFRRSSINYYALNVIGIGRGTGHSDYALRWQQPGDELITNVPSAADYNSYDYNRDEAYRFADILVENAAHIRLKDVTLSYDLPAAIVRKGVLKSVQLYIYLDNVGILWRANKHGIDPDFVPLGFSNYLPMPFSCTGGIKVDL